MRNVKHRLYDIDLCVGMILRDLDASGIYSYIKIIENNDGQFYYDYSEDSKNFHHGFRRNVSDLCSIAFFEIVSDPRIIQKRTFVYYISSERYNRRSGGKTLGIVVNEIVNNIPSYCGAFSVKTASYNGDVFEVMNFSFAFWDY